MSEREVKCPYCERHAELVGGEVIYPHRPDLGSKKFWLCTPCNAYVGCHAGDDGTRPLGRLTAADLLDKARRQDFWEQYSRDTFLAHTEFVPAEKLRFLQYINAKSKGWWQGHRDKGAILLGPSSSN